MLDQEAKHTKIEAKIREIYEPLLKGNELIVQPVLDLAQYKIANRTRMFNHGFVASEKHSALLFDVWLQDIIARRFPEMNFSRVRILTESPRLLNKLGVFGLMWRQPLTRNLKRVFCFWISAPRRKMGRKG